MRQCIWDLMRYKQEEKRGKKEKRWEHEKLVLFKVFFLFITKPKQGANPKVKWVQGKAKLAEGYTLRLFSCVCIYPLGAQILSLLYIKYTCIQDIVCISLGLVEFASSLYFFPCKFQWKCRFNWFKNFRILTSASYTTCQWNFLV